MKQEKLRLLSGSTLKLIAIATMFIDHIGAGILEQNYLPQGQAAMQLPLFQADFILRMIGRVAFPIFCFLLVEGYTHTSDVQKYLKRLFLFALISEIPFDLTFNGKILEGTYQNVYFTLFLGLAAIYCYEQISRRGGGYRFAAVLSVIALVIMGTLLHTDYGSFGVFIIFLLYYTHKRRGIQAITGAVCFSFEITAPLAFIPIYLYNGKRGWSLKYLFYAFYPVHLLLIYIIGQCFFPGP